MQQVMLALSIATFEGYLAEIYEVGRQILQSTNKRGCHIGIDISSSTVQGLFTWPFMLNNLVPEKFKLLIFL